MKRICLLLCWLSQQAFAADPIPKIPRVLPPTGIELPDADRRVFTTSLADLQTQLKPISHPLKADVSAMAKAVDFALRHGEFFDAKELPRATAVLKLAHERVKELAVGRTPWTTQHGLVVRGFHSRIDGSPQPYGLVIPEGLDLAKLAPLYVWLHGRGDKQTDLHFIHERMTRPGQIAPPNAIVVHPLGRQCLGFKSAGETDVLEAVEHVQTQYRIDPDRIVLIGFSMGGAGAWHLGAHYPDRWVAVSPGAGFAETARYQNLKPESVPFAERTLWGAYDVPAYVRNLFNVPVIAYSGEIDKQIQAARVMEEAFAEHGEKLRHLIGPNTEHKYHPETLKQLLAELDAVVRTGKNRSPDRVSLQTRTLRYNRVAWVEVLGLEKHWQDARVDATRSGESIELRTKNVSSLRLHTPAKAVSIDGQKLTANAAVKTNGKWEPLTAAASGLVKRHGLQGPIDDAFLEPFLVVTPTGKSANESIGAWVDFELAHFRDRWRGAFRGELREKTDREVTDDDLRNYHVVVWGDPSSNALLQRLADKLPVKWTAKEVALAGKAYAASNHVPLLIYPNPLNPDRYVVVNSGPTFREAHDKTNSQQNPKLADWAIIDVSTPPNAVAPGKVVATDFFDEHWRP